MLPSSDPLKLAPTSRPSADPSEEPTQQPTVAPTELCTALTLTVATAGVAAVTTYNGIYMKQTTLVNSKDWWKQRFTDAVHLTITGDSHEGLDGVD